MAMIIGMGSDLVYIPRIAATYKRQGRRFLNRCFTPAEIDYVLSTPIEAQQAARLAKRWAAKEAFGKALGTGIARGVTLRDIGVCRGADGVPGLELTGGAQACLQARATAGGRVMTYLSLADDHEYAQAFVVLWLEKD